MKEELCNKINSLSPRDKKCFFNGFYDILNDRWSCFYYGGINDHEYSNLPKDKLDVIKEKLYEEMFCYTTFPRISMLGVSFLGFLIL